MEVDNGDRRGGGRGRGRGRGGHGREGNEGQIRVGGRRRRRRENRQRREEHEARQREQERQQRVEMRRMQNLILFVDTLFQNRPAGGRGRGMGGRALVGGRQRRQELFQNRAAAPEIREGAHAGWQGRALGGGVGNGRGRAGGRNRRRRNRRRRNRRGACGGVPEQQEQPIRA